MSDATSPLPRAAIVDYGMGNLFSVQQACTSVGLASTITTSPREIAEADGIILPGVGGMPDAMRQLGDSGLAGVLIECAAAGKPLLGVCLGLQLLMAVGTEFERHRGLGILPGEVLPLDRMQGGGRGLKLPHVGWAPVRRRHPSLDNATDPWALTPFGELSDGQFMYFVHSYYVRPDDPSVCVGTAQYGASSFCALVHRDNVFGCQFHPERSGPPGLRIYKRFATLLHQSSAEHPSQ